MILDGGGWSSRWCLEVSVRVVGIVVVVGGPWRLCLEVSVGVVRIVIVGGYLSRWRLVFDDRVCWEVLSVKK